MGVHRHPTRRDILAAGASAFLLPQLPFGPGRQRPVPSPSQLPWQQDELALALEPPRPVRVALFGT